METKIYLIISMAVLVWVCPAQGVLDDKIFTSSGQILPGEEWDIVNIYNDDTVVDMLGGSADWIATHDGSTLNVVGGSADVGAFDYSNLHISGGALGIVRSWGSSALSFSDSAVADSIRNAGFTIATITGGTTSDVRVADSASVFLYGGMVTDYLSGYDASSINIYGYGLVLSSGGGTYGDGRVYGYWLDGNAFVINLRGAETQSHINLIPEPATVALLAMGGLLLQRHGRILEKVI